MVKARDTGMGKGREAERALLAFFGCGELDAPGVFDAPDVSAEPSADSGAARSRRGHAVPDSPLLVAGLLGR